MKHNESFMHDCSKQLKIQQDNQTNLNKNTHNNPNQQHHYLNFYSKTKNDKNENNNVNHYDSQCLNENDSDFLGISCSDAVDGVDEQPTTMISATATTTAASVQKIHNLQLTQWWFLMMQQTIFNVNTTIQQEQQQQQQNLSNDIFHSNETVATYLTKESTHNFNVFDFINENKNNNDFN